MKKFFTPDHYFDGVDKIPVGFFKEKHIEVIFCDIDNTLVKYSDLVSTQYSREFLKRASDEGVGIVLLSNNTDLSRGGMFGEYKEITYFPKAKKPLSRKIIKKYLKNAGKSKDSAVVMGDQIFTDVLAGRFAGVRAILVDPLGPSMIPLFGIKRFFEKPIKKNFIKKYGKNV